MPRAIVLHSDDDIATLIDGASRGDTVEFSGKKNGKLPLAADIPYGHKFALSEIPAGKDILKYGQVIGRATTAIRPGEHVHVHNVEALRARGDI